MINEHKIACFGGSDRSDGFVVDLRDNSIYSILGAENDLSFTCNNQEQRIGSQKFVTIFDARSDISTFIHILQLFAGSHGSYFETRSIRNFGLRNRQF